MKDLSNVSAPEACFNPRIMDSAFALPVVLDTYTSLTSLASPILPVVNKTVGTGHKVTQALRTAIESNLPIFMTRPAERAASNTISTLDYIACTGLDILVTRLPHLKEPTPVLIQTTKNTVSALADETSSYIGSLSVSKFAVKMTGRGVETAQTVVTMSGLHHFSVVLTSLNIIDVAFLYGTVCEILGFSYIVICVTAQGLGKVMKGARLSLVTLRLLIGCLPIILTYLLLVVSSSYLHLQEQNVYYNAISIISIINDKVKNMDIVLDISCGALHVVGIFNDFLLSFFSPVFDFLASWRDYMERKVEESGFKSERFLEYINLLSRITKTMDIRSGNYPGSGNLW